MTAGLPGHHGGGNVVMADKILDEEWLELMTKAKLMGLTPEEIRTFLSKNAKQANA